MPVFAIPFWVIVIYGSRLFLELLDLAGSRISSGAPCLVWHLQKPPPGQIQTWVVDSRGVLAASIGSDLPPPHLAAELNNILTTTCALVASVEMLSNIVSETALWPDRLFAQCWMQYACGFHQAEASVLRINLANESYSFLTIDYSLACWTRTSTYNSARSCCQ